MAILLRNELGVSFDHSFIWDELNLKWLEATSIFGFDNLLLQLPVRDIV